MVTVQINTPRKHCQPPLDNGFLWQFQRIPSKTCTIFIMLCVKTEDTEMGVDQEVRVLFEK